MGFFVLGCAAAPIMPRSPAPRQIPAKFRHALQDFAKAAQQPPTRHAPRAAHPAAKSRPKFHRARRSTVKTPRRPTKHNKKNIYMKNPRAENPGAYQKQKRLKAIWLISSGYHFLFLWRPAFCISGRQNPARRRYHTRTQCAPHWSGSNGRQTNMFYWRPHLCA